MDILGIIDLPVWLIITVGLLVGAYYYYTWNFGILSKLGIPGPKPYPVLGSVNLFFKHSFFDVDKVLMDKYGSCYGVYFGRAPSVTVGDVELMRRILIKDFQNFQDRVPIPFRGILKKGIFDAREEQWRYLRHLMTPAFTTGKLKQMMPLFKVTADRFVNNVLEETKENKAFDMKEFSSAFTMDTIASVAFGLDIDSQKEKNNIFVTKMKEFLNINVFHPVMIVLFFLPFLIPVLEALHYADILMKPAYFFVDVVKETIKQRRQNIGVRVDILQLLIDAEKHASEVQEDEVNEEAGGNVKLATSNKKSGGLSEEDILAQGLLFFLAGYDTVGNTLAFFIHFIAKYPEVQNRILQEIDDVMQGREEPTYEDLAKVPYLEMCIYETLRMYPPIARADRFCIEDYEYQGFKIPKNTPVVIPIRALHYNPDVWPHPDKFDPERFSPEAKSERDSMNYMPFGLGPRMCIGMRLAMIELKVVLIKLFLKVRLETCNKSEEKVELKKSFLTTPENGVWVKAKLR